MNDLNDHKFMQGKGKLGLAFAMQSKEQTKSVHEKFQQKAMQNLNIYAYTVMTSCFFGMDHHPDCAPS